MTSPKLERLAASTHTEAEYLAERCPDCNGTGWLAPHTWKCSACNGTGKKERST